MKLNFVILKILHPGQLPKQWMLRTLVVLSIVANHSYSHLHMDKVKAWVVDLHFVSRKGTEDC